MDESPRTSACAKIPFPEKGAASYSSATRTIRGRRIVMASDDDARARSIDDSVRARRRRAREKAHRSIARERRERSRTTARTTRATKRKWRKTLENAKTCSIKSTRCVAESRARDAIDARDALKTRARARRRLTPDAGIREHVVE